WFMCLRGKDGKEMSKRLGEDDRDASLGWFIIVGTLPIVIAGVLFQKTIESTLRNLWITVVMLIVFGLLLWYFDAKSKQTKTIKEMTLKDAALFGVGQMLALIPGVSRSGGTITFGRALGYTREDAARISFLMAIPAVFGAGILETVKSLGDVGSASGFPGWGATICATLVSFVVGYLVIIAFLKIVSTFSYKGFAVYRIAIAIVVALLLITGALAPLAGSAA
ncbi:MAG: UDP-diphosphatase, partial [Bifidobacterium crudilactis]|nr:UDP-diphosphatase [Bifidobacterium crudilactis]